MADEYVKGVPNGAVTYDFTEWTWEPFDGDSLKKLIEANAELVASEMFDSMTMNVRAWEDGPIRVSMNCEAVPDAWFSFDLAEAVAGACEGIETQYSKKFRDQHKEETRAELLALRVKFSALVDVIDASPSMKGSE